VLFRASLAAHRAPSDLEKQDGQQKSGECSRRDEVDQEEDASGEARSLLFGLGVHVPITSIYGRRLLITLTVSVIVGNVSLNSRTPIIGYSLR